MTYQRSVVNRQEVRIDLLEVIRIHDRLDSGGQFMGVLITDHPSSALTLTVEEEEDRMVVLHRALKCLRDVVRGHINPSQH